MSIYILCLLVMVAAPTSEVVGAQPGMSVLDFDPGLVDVNGLYVVAEVREHQSFDPNVSEFSPQLAEFLETRLDEAGVSVTKPDLAQLDETTASVLLRRLDVDPNTVFVRMAHVPVLKVTVDLVPSETKTSLAMYARTTFARQVSLGDRTFIATVWSADPAVKSVRSARWQEEIRKVAADQVEAFIAARKTAAAHDGKAPPPLPMSVSPRRAADTLAYPFLASKNSSVFHGADCRMAQNIATENLVGYNSREEAVAAGRRPCKTCNP